jgi:hypothetical protein
MDGDTDNFDLETHKAYGKQLKHCQHYLEGLRANLTVKYPKSSKKETRQIEQVIEKLKLVQTSLHGRLSIEYAEKPDDELLPVYLGRL